MAALERQQATSEATTFADPAEKGWTGRDRGSSQSLGNLHVRAQGETHLSLAWGRTTPANVGFDGRVGGTGVGLHLLSEAQIILHLPGSPQITGGWERWCLVCSHKVGNFPNTERGTVTKKGEMRPKLVNSRFQKISGAIIMIII